MLVRPFAATGSNSEAGLAKMAYTDRADAPATLKNHEVATSKTVVSDLNIMEVRY